MDICKYQVTLFAGGHRMSPNLTISLVGPTLDQRFPCKESPANTAKRGRPGQVLEPLIQS